MAKPLYKQRQESVLDPTFGIWPVVAVLFAFLAIHTHLAARLPETIFEAELLGPFAANRTGFLPSHWLADLGRLHR